MVSSHYVFVFIKNRLYLRLCFIYKRQRMGYSKGKDLFLPVEMTVRGSVSGVVSKKIVRVVVFYKDAINLSGLAMTKYAIKSLQKIHLEQMMLVKLLLHPFRLEYTDTMNKTRYFSLCPESKKVYKAFFTNLLKNIMPRDYRPVNNL